MFQTAELQQQQQQQQQQKDVLCDKPIANDGKLVSTSQPAGNALASYLQAASQSKHPGTTNRMFNKSLVSLTKPTRFGNLYSC
jgi:hypothetical protein